MRQNQLFFKPFQQSNYRANWQQYARYFGAVAFVHNMLYGISRRVVSVPEQRAATNLARYRSYTSLPYVTTALNLYQTTSSYSNFGKNVLEPHIIFTTQKRNIHSKIGLYKNQEFHDIISGILQGNDNQDILKIVRDILVTYNINKQTIFMYLCMYLANTQFYIAEIGEADFGTKLYNIAEIIFDKDLESYLDKVSRIRPVSDSEVDEIIEIIRSGKINKGKAQVWHGMAYKILSTYSDGKLPEASVASFRKLLKLCLNYHKIMPVACDVIDSINVEELSFEAEGLKLLTEYPSDAGKELYLVVGGPGVGKSFYINHFIKKQDAESTVYLSADALKNAEKEYINKKAHLYDSQFNISDEDIQDTSELHVVSSALGYIIRKRIESKFSKNENSDGPCKFILEQYFLTPDIMPFARLFPQVKVVKMVGEMSEIQDNIERRKNEVGRSIKRGDAISVHKRSAKEIAEDVGLLKEKNINFIYEVVFSGRQGFDSIGSTTSRLDRFNIESADLWQPVAETALGHGYKKGDSGLVEYFNQLQKNIGVSYNFPKKTLQSLQEAGLKTYLDKRSAISKTRTDKTIEDSRYR